MSELETLREALKQKQNVIEYLEERGEDLERRLVGLAGQCDCGFCRGIAEPMWVCDGCGMAWKPDDASKRGTEEES